MKRPALGLLRRPSSRRHACLQAALVQGFGKTKRASQIELVQESLGIHMLWRDSCKPLPLNCHTGTALTAQPQLLQSTVLLIAAGSTRSRVVASRMTRSSERSSWCSSYIAVCSKIENQQPQSSRKSSHFSDCWKPCHANLAKACRTLRKRPSQDSWDGSFSGAAVKANWPSKGIS